jgi:hypothetical protein
LMLYLEAFVIWNTIYIYTVRHVLRGYLQDKERVVLYKPVLRDHLWENTSSVIRQMTSQQRFNSHESLNDKKRQDTMLPFNTDNCLLELTLWTGLTARCSHISNRSI